MDLTINNESFSAKLYRSRKILLEQLEYLGYDISEYNNFSINDIYTQKENKQLSFMVTHKNGKKKYIYYHISKALRPAHIYELIEQLYHVDETLTENDELCIISKESVNSTIKAKQKEIMIEDNIFITVRSIQSIQYNILKHALVPKHRILSDDEKTTLFEKYNIKGNDKLPEISRFDPVAIIIGIRPTQVCEIIRPNKTSLDSNYYRICC
jgi:DNA-directed RNA polymerase subunit H (RpoH/RPB5)